MNAFNYIILFLILIAGISFFYKVYLQIKIKNPEKEITFFSVLIRFYTIMDFLPLKPASKNEDETKARKKANTYIFIFYGSFVLAILLSLFAK